MPSPPLILTLKIDNESFEFFDRLRSKYFPPERNFLKAHITLFHHLPGEKLAEICQNISDVCLKINFFPLLFTNWRFLGKGSAMNIESNELLRLRTTLATRWRNDLTRQDSQKFQPHITVQNKVSPDEAKDLYKSLSSEWKLKTGTAEGLSLWHYIAPRWELEKDFAFK